MKAYPYKVFRKGLLRSEHMSRADAETKVGNLLKMSRGRLTAADFEIVDLTVSAVLASRRLAKARTKQNFGIQLEFGWISSDTSTGQS